MKKIVSMILCLCMVVGTCALMLTSCTESKTYEIALVTDVGQLMDKGFNQGTHEGAEKYAKDHNLTYKYYQPANGDKATDNDRFNAMKAAADAGAKIIVCAGFLQETALRRAAETFPEV